MKIEILKINDFSIFVKKGKFELKFYLMEIENLNGCHILKMKTNKEEKFRDFTFFDKVLTEMNK